LHFLTLHLSASNTAIRVMTKRPHMIELVSYKFKI
jgi:hypothetical protein